MEPPSGFEHGTPGLGIQRLNHYAIAPYDTMFEFFTKKNLTSDNQSGSKPGDSCVNQLLSITHEIYQSFGNNLEVRDVFLDIFRAFDKV